MIRQPAVLDLTDYWMGFEQGRPHHNPDTGEWRWTFYGYDDADPNRVRKGAV